MRGLFLSRSCPYPQHTDNQSKAMLKNYAIDLFDNRRMNDVMYMPLDNRLYRTKRVRMDMLRS